MVTHGPTLRIGFEVGERSDLGGAAEVIPSVNGELLTALVDAFERARKYGPADAYGGIIPSIYRFGPLGAHYLGMSTQRPASKVPLLGCACGEWGCWPLLATIRATEENVVWSEFEQPHRKERDYKEFGPFEFARVQYDEALAQLTTVLEQSDE